MKHEIHRVVSFKRIGRLALHVEFEDGVGRDIDFSSVLAGELLGPLRDESVFAQARLDKECGVIVWPNGADFDPALLHDWPTYAGDMAAMAARWDSNNPAGALKAREEALCVAEERVEYGEPRTASTFAEASEDKSHPSKAADERK